MIVKLKEDEKTIYLSASLRTTLDIKDGDNIGFGFNDSNGTILLYKEIEPNQGWLVENGQIVSSADWRELYQIFESTTLYYNLSDGTISDLDYPDYEFYLLSTHDNSKKKSGSTESIETNTEDKFVQSQYWKPTNLSNNAAGIKWVDKPEVIADIKEVEDTVEAIKRNFTYTLNRPYIFENPINASDSITESNEEEKEDKKLEL